MANLVIKVLALSLKSLDVRGQALKLALSGHWLLENHFNALEALLLILELSSEYVIAELTIAPRFRPEVVKHPVRRYIVAVHFPDIHQPLLHSE